MNQQITPNEIVDSIKLWETKKFHSKEEYVLVIKLKLDQTVFEFENEGGAGTFIRHMARKLQIDIDCINIISVSSDDYHSKHHSMNGWHDYGAWKKIGSVVLDFSIKSEPRAKKARESLLKLSDAFSRVEDNDFGPSILSLQ